MTAPAKPGVLGATILTQSGVYFDFERPHLSEIRPEDIARGLAHANRFQGQTRFGEPYSVAQHSALACMIVPREDAFAALMHDSPEAYVGDVPSPLKQLLPEYKRIESRVWRAIAAKFGLPLLLPPSVKHADIRMLKAEREDLMPQTDEAWPGMDAYERFPNPIVPWSAQKAEKVWLACFEALYQPAKADA